MIALNSNPSRPSLPPLPSPPFLSKARLHFTSVQAAKTAIDIIAERHKMHR